MAGLTNLEELYLENNQLGTLGGLSSLTSLTTLNLHVNNVSELTPLAGLTSIENLNLRDNHITNIEPLSGLTTLTELYIGGNEIGTITALSLLTNLQSLDLSGTGISDLTPLAGMIGLETLHACCNGLDDLSPLSGLINLQYLGLDWNEITDISPLSPLSNLTGMNLIGNRISELAPLTNMMNLSYLNMPYSPLSWQSQCTDIPTIRANNPSIELCAEPNPYDCSVENVTVNMPDPNLKAAVIEKLGLTEDPTTGDMALLNWFNADQRGIQNLTGLEYARNLQGLWLNENEISDISPVANLTHLEQLELHNNQISTIPSLSALTNLTRLGLSNNQINDITRLTGLTGLEELQLHNNQISNISELSGLTSLIALGLGDNQITTVPSLSSLGSLEFLNLYGNQITDASGVSGLNNLVELILTLNQLSTLPDLSSSVRLKVLTAEKNQLTDISGLTGLKNLEMVNLHKNRIVDIRPLLGMNKITNLSLIKNLINDITPLSGMSGLTYLKLQINQINDVGPLTGLTGLRELHLGQNQISTLSPLAGLTDLVFLGLDDNSITDISLLSTLVNLKDLDLARNQISNIDALSGMSQLTALFLFDNQISSISALSDKTSLRELVLANNQIADMSVLDGLTQLEVLDISRNQIDSLSFLAGLTKLQRLEAAEIGISDIPTLTGFTDLVHLDLGNNQIFNVSPLDGLASLEYLSLQGNQVMDIGDLAGLNNLVEFLAGGNPIQDISALSDKINLRFLIMPGCQIDDLIPLSSSINMERLVLCDNQINDITPLSGMTRLNRLYLEHNQIGNINAVLNMPNLERLRLEYNQISILPDLLGLGRLNVLILNNNELIDISGLTEVNNFQMLDLTNNQINNIAPLADLTNLNELFLSNNQITDLGPLVGLSNLWHLRAQDNGVVDAIALGSMPNLEVIDLSNNAISDVSPFTNLLQLMELNLKGNPLTLNSCCNLILTISDNNPGINLQTSCDPDDCLDPSLVNRILEDGFETIQMLAEWNTFSSTEAYFDQVDGKLQITANGVDIWRDHDEYGVVFTPVFGDFEAIVKIESQEYTHDWAKAGIAVRNNMTEAGSAAGYVNMVITPTRYSFQWDEQPGFANNSLTRLMNHPDYPDSPHGSEIIVSLATPEYWGDNYGQRIRGSIQPAESGNYTFFVAGDDAGELWLSTDNDSANATLIAVLPGMSAPGEYDKYPEQQSAAIWLDAGQTYYIEALHQEGQGGDHFEVAWQGNTWPEPQIIPGSFTREWWITPLPDWLSVAGLQSHPDYPNSPHGSETVASLAGPLNWADYYGQRIGGFIQPAESGNYTFFMAGDDTGELWLSTDDNPANATLIASVPNWTFPGQYDKYPDLKQQSALISLDAGQTYYIEALHKEAGGGDHVEVAWQREGWSAPQIVPGSFTREWWMDEEEPPSDGFIETSIKTAYNTSVLPSWLRLKKRGTTFTGYYSTFSPDGPWSKVASATLENANTIQDVGMIVTSHSLGDLCTVVFDDFYLADEADTPSGENVEVSEPEAGVIMTFDKVETTGETTIVVTEQGPEPPTGFQLADPPTYYDITTTASFLGQIEICIDYSGLAYNGPEEGLRLLHYDSSQGWIDCTTTVNTVNDLIYGLVESLSPFVVVQHPKTLIGNLATLVADLNLHKGTANSLLAKLRIALKKLDDTNEANDVAAINAINAFINKVEAQSGKKIPAVQANQLLSAAQAIVDLLTSV